MDPPGTHGGTAGADGGRAGTSTGGSAGNTAGTAGGGSMTPPNLIDDFEDWDLTLKDVGDRSGVWYVFNDGTTGTQGPKPLACAALKDSSAPEELGSYGLEITATGFSDYGSGLGADFVDGHGAYDASKYTGVHFWAKAAGKTTEYRFQMPDATTDPSGGKCDGSATAATSEKCSNHFGTALMLTATWAEYTVHFNELKQLGSWGKRATALDSAHVYGLQLTAKAMSDVDLWVDQFEFLE